VCLTGLVDGVFRESDAPAARDLRLHVMIRSERKEDLAAAPQGLGSLRTVESVREDRPTIAARAGNREPFNKWGERHQAAGWKFEAHRLDANLNHGTGWVKAVSPNGWVYLADRYEVELDGVIEFTGRPAYHAGDGAQVSFGEEAVLRVRTTGTKCWIEVIDKHLQHRIEEKGTGGSPSR
jgi:hypothetical protein